MEHDTSYRVHRGRMRENKSDLFSTLTANTMSRGHESIVRVGDRIRGLTPHECFRLQGFDDEYVLSSGVSDAQQYKLAGNAVTDDVVKLMARSILRLMVRNKCNHSSISSPVNTLFAPVPLSRLTNVRLRQPHPAQ